MGSGISCHSSSSENGPSKCNTYATSDAQLSTSAIIGIVIGSVVAFILLVILVILLLRALSRRYPMVHVNQQPYFFYGPPPPPQSQPYPTHKYPDPPPYPGTTGI